MRINKITKWCKTNAVRLRSAEIHKIFLKILIAALCCIILRLFFEHNSSVIIFDNTYKSFEAVIPSTTRSETQNNTAIWLEIGLTDELVSNVVRVSFWEEVNLDLYDSRDLPIEMNTYSNAIWLDIKMNFETDTNIIVKRTSRQPINKVEETGQSPYYSLGEYTITAYCPCVECCEIWSKQHPSRKGTAYVQRTASGTIPTAGRTCAADNNVLPYGTVLLINNHEYIVEDTGGATKGKKLIDIFFDTHAEAVAFGRQKAEVWVKHSGS